MNRTDLKDIYEFFKKITGFLGESLRPFPFIKELGDIRSFEDIIQLNSFVYSMVPWVQDYYDIATLSCMENRSSVDYLYRRMQRKEIGGWCGLSVDFLDKLLIGYEIPHRTINVGFPDKNLTHMVVLISVGSTDYLFDPYFDRYYVDAEGKPLSYETFLFFIKAGEYDQVIPRHGEILKPVQKEGSWVYMNSEEFKEYALAGVLEELKGLIAQKYGNDNYLNIFLSEF